MQRGKGSPGLEAQGSGWISLGPVALLALAHMPSVAAPHPGGGAEAPPSEHARAAWGWQCHPPGLLALARPTDGALAQPGAASPNEPEAELEPRCCRASARRATGPIEIQPAPWASAPGCPRPDARILALTSRGHSRIPRPAPRVGCPGEITFSGRPREGVPCCGWKPTGVPRS